MNTSRLLANYVCELQAEALRPDCREAALRCVFDLLAAAAAGFQERSSHAVRRVALSQYGSGTAGIWFTNQRTSVTGAVFCNSAAASALDLDDGFRLARGHPGAAAIPAAIAALADVDISADELLTAVIAGYEVGVRVAVGRHGYGPSGTWSPYAAIAAAGRVRRTKPEHLAHAFAISAQCAPALGGLAGLMGSDVKEGIPWGATTGMTALFLAESGYTGPEEILDSPALFANERIVQGLGEPPLIGRTYFKPYACCRHIHAPVEAFTELLRRHSLSAKDIVAVEIYTYSGTFNLSNARAPRDLVEAQYSVPYCIGVCAVRGASGLLPLDPSDLGEAGVLEVAGRVSLHRDPDLEAQFPARSPARVVVTTARGRFESPVTMPRGDPDDPLSWAELEAKFMAATRHTLTLAQQHKITAAIDRLKHGDPDPLRSALGPA